MQTTFPSPPTSLNLKTKEVFKVIVLISIVTVLSAFFFVTRTLVLKQSEAIFIPDRITGAHARLPRHCREQQIETTISFLL